MSEAKIMGDSALGAQASGLAGVAAAQPKKIRCKSCGHICDEAWTTPVAWMTRPECPRCDSTQLEDAP